MHFTSQALADGVFEQLFVLGDIPGALWTPGGAGGTRPLIVMGHGGQHKKAPSIVDRARRFVAECGFAVVAVDAPSHGDRPDHVAFTRIATEYEGRLDAGEGLGPLIASFQALAALTYFERSRVCTKRTRAPNSGPRRWRTPC